MRYRETLRALASPRRALPIGILASTMIGAQVALSGSWLAGLIAVLLVASFLLTAPSSYRVLFDPAGPSRVPVAARLIVFLVLALAVVLPVGAALPRLLGVGPTLFGATPSLAIGVALFLVGGWGLARDIDLERSVAQERTRGDALVRDVEAARLLAMRTHLDPHFLFNTLNAIAEHCREDGAVAERAILDLAEVLRTLMEGVQRSAWPLAREIGLARAVLDLHHVRDPGRFSLVITVPDETEEIEVPPLLLLPLVENAMTHGPAKGHRGEVTLDVIITPREVRVELTNPGRYGGRREAGTGISTVQKRLELFYPKGSSLTVMAVSDRTRASLGLPRPRLPTPVLPITNPRETLS